MNVKRKKFDCIDISTIGRGRDVLRTDMLSETIKLFHKKRVTIEIDMTVKETTNWNQEIQNNTLMNNIDLIKEANEKYNTLRNTVFLEILEKYKNNKDKDFLSYEYLFKKILDSYKLLNEYDTTDCSNIPRSVYLDNKIRVHNMVMKLICGSRQIEHSSSIEVSLSNNLSQIIRYFHGKPLNKPGIIANTCVEYIDNTIRNDTKQSESITLDEIDRVVEEIDKMNNLVFEENNVINDIPPIEDINQKERVSSITTDSRYLLFLKRTSPTLMKFCETPDEFVMKHEDLIREKGIVNEAIFRKKRLGSIKDLEVLPAILPIEDVKWAKRDINKFNACVIRYKNNFTLYRNELPHIPTKELIKKYYLSKDKTYSHIKKKSGRISDSEIKTIVEKEWSQGEIEIFKEKYSLYGNNLSKYQTWINKTEKDLKIFLRYFLKQRKTSKPEVVHRPSLTKEDILNYWSIDERQIFAIYFPYFNKNWITMATYFPKKSSAELKLYYTKYFKGLSYNEQKFEASILNLKVLFMTHPVIHVRDDSHEDEFLKSIGIIFKKKL